MSKTLYTLSSINQAISGDVENFVNTSEDIYTNQLNKLKNNIISNPGKKIIMVAGPSASGKTTSAKKLAELINKEGINAYTVSLDDFYLNRDEVPRFEDGKLNFETVYALDLQLLSKCLNEIVNDRHTILPIFDFIIGGRSKDTNELTLKEDDVVIVEGLHALNPIITDCLPQESLLKIYISISSRIFDDKGNVLLTKRNMRFLRRAVRDYNFRNSSIENTYKLWKSVQFGENEYLFPYRPLADISIDSFHSYETCIFKTIATALFQELPRDSEYYDECQKILSVLDKFSAISQVYVPQNSLLREFIGK